MDVKLLYKLQIVRQTRGFIIIQDMVWVLSDIYEVYRDGLVSFLLGLALGYQDI